MESVKGITAADEMEDQIVETCPSGRYVRFEDKLGAGAFKTVFRALDTELGIEVAWNRIGLDRFQLDKSKVLREISFFQQIRHQNVIEFYDFWMDENQVVFITELMPSGTLKEYITKSPEVKVKIIKGWCKQILTGLNYLHTRNPPIIHRDIKCDNIFINGTSSEGEVKIGDLGLATLSLRKEHLSVIGTPEFMAPEYYNENYSTSVDIWAFGMAIIEMVTLECPYAECDNVGQIFKKVSAGVLPKQLDAIEDREVREFVELCLADELHRPTAAELLAHRFFSLDESSSTVLISSSSNGINPSKKLRERSLSTTNGSPSITPLNSNHQSQTLSHNPPVPLNLHSPHPGSSSGLTSTNTSPTNPPPTGTNVQTQISLSPPVNQVKNGKTTPTVTPPSSPQQDRQHGRTPSFSDPKVVLIENANRKPTNNIIEMKLLLDILGEHTEIKFEYNLITDTAENVAKEMVNELQLTGAQDDICRLIQQQVDSFQKLYPQPVVESSNVSVNTTTEEKPPIPQNVTANPQSSVPIGSTGELPSESRTLQTGLTPTSSTATRESITSTAPLIPSQLTTSEYVGPSQLQPSSNQPIQGVSSTSSTTTPSTNTTNAANTTMNLNETSLPHRSSSSLHLSASAVVPTTSKGSTASGNELSSSSCEVVRVSNSLDSVSLAVTQTMPTSTTTVTDLEFLAAEDQDLDSSLDPVSHLFTVPPNIGTANDMADLEDLLDSDSDAEYDRGDAGNTSDSPIGWPGDPSDSEESSLIPVALLDSSLDPYGSSSTDDDEQELLALKRKHEQALRDLLEMQKKEIRQLSERHQQRRNNRTNLNFGDTSASENQEETTKALQEYYKVQNSSRLPPSGDNSNSNLKGSSDTFATSSEI